MKKVSYIFILTMLAAIVLPQAVDGRPTLEPRGENEERSTQTTDSNADIRELVEREFGEGHVMVDVARCESSFRQFNVDGDPLVNSIGATGVFQILQRVHEDIAEDLDFDIYDAGDNIAYAKRLYEADGLKPWSPSSLCWDDGDVDEASPELDSPEERERAGVLRQRLHGEERTQPAERADNSDDDNYPEVISKRLVIGVDDEEVRRLQELLNELGFGQAADGPGSPGEETSFFGNVTKAGLREFQCEMDIVCSGSEYTTGYGLAGVETRQALNKAAARGTTANRVVRRSDEEADESEANASSALQAQIDELTQMIADLRARIN